MESSLAFAGSREGHRPLDLELRSNDRHFGVTLERAQLDELLRLCERSGPLETGGILIGRYTPRHDMAIVTCIVPPPPDSYGSATSFFRGWQGLRAVLSRFWHRRVLDRQYYLGEWHFHPGAGPLPSPEDRSQMQDIARSEKYSCPEPILMIVGGGPESGWSLATHVFRRAGRELPLFEGGNRSLAVVVPRVDKST